MRLLKHMPERLGLALLIAALGAAGLSLVGCNTTEGFGKDLEAAGDSIEDAADDAND